MVAEVEEIKQRLADEVDRRADLLIDVSHQIHARPELCFEERFAHDLLTGVIAGDGLEVERHAYGLDTAFDARAGVDGPTVAVLCEYDALPGIGHACGHNIIAAAGLGAGLATAALADEVGGRVALLGTPAEEGGGGKQYMVEAGAFDGVDMAMMVHPADAELVRMDVVALQQAVVSYHGQAAHAAAFPHKGRNALDACVLGYMNVAALRQHMAPGERIHGVITDGGAKPNIVPEFARSEWNVRSVTAARRDQLVERFVACIEAGARAAGCEATIEWPHRPYDDMVHSTVLGACYRENGRRLGREVGEPAPGNAVVASTDMGNVSYVVPSIHPVIQVAPPGTPIHTPAFAGYAAGPEGDRAVVDGAKLLAWTVADAWLDAGLRRSAREEWEVSVGR
jgi:amidohydrolase